MNRTEVLEQLLSAAREVFGHDVRAEDNFFALGGDSLTAVELAANLERRLDRLVDFTVIVTADTLSAAADRLADSRPARGGAVR